MFITSYDFDAIWLEGEPQATEAFNRLVADHGRRFAEYAREVILTAKLIQINEESIGLCGKIVQAHADQC